MYMAGVAVLALESHHPQLSQRKIDAQSGTTNSRTPFQATDVKWCVIYNLIIFIA